MRVFETQKNYKCRNMLNIAKIESQESEKAPTLHWRHWRIRSRAGIMPRCCIWKPAYRTHPSSPSRGSRNLALPASASGGGWGCRTGQRLDQSLPTKTAHGCPALLPRLSWSCWPLTFLSHGHHSLDLTGGFVQRTPHQGPRTRNLHLLTVFKFYGGFKKSWES